MSWYIHPSKQLRDDELPPELVVTNRDGSVEQVYVPYNASDQLETENAKLWERIHKLEMEGSDHFYRTAYAEDANRTLEAENAKLRELVLDMHKALFSLNLDYCQACPREDACVFVHKSFDCDECAFERDMRELGIEVG